MNKECLLDRGYTVGFMFNGSCDICEDLNIVHIYSKMIDTTELVIRVWPDNKIDYFVDPGKQIRWSRDIEDLKEAFQMLENDLRSVGLD